MSKSDSDLCTQCQRKIEARAKELAKKYPWMEGLCLSCAKDKVARAKIAKVKTKPTEAEIKEARERNQEEQKRRSDEVAIRYVAELFGTEKATIVAWLIEQGLLESRSVGFSHSFIYVKKKDVLHLIDLIESDDPSLDSRIPDYLLVRWKVRLPRIRQLIADGALNK